MSGEIYLQVPAMGECYVGFQSHFEPGVGVVIDDLSGEWENIQLQVEADKVEELVEEIQGRIFRRYQASQNNRLIPDWAVGLLD